eukprot:Nk52_evm2s354 gene=Nk52_evmTU2s354
MTEFNWSGLVHKLPEAARPELAVLRAKYTDLQSKLETLPDKKPEINWAYFKSVISAPGIVERYQKEFDSLNVPKPENKALANIEKNEAEFKKQGEQARENTMKMIADLEAKLNAIHAERPLDELTVDEVLAANPAWKKEAEEKLKDNRWEP